MSVLLINQVLYYKEVSLLDYQALDENGFPDINFPLNKRFG